MGFISSFFVHRSSVADSFLPTIRRLPKALFDVSLIAFHREGATSTVADIKLPELSPDMRNLDSLREPIARKRLDVLVYLDLFMQSDMHHLALSRLAPAQANTHGHPVTSGISPNASWADGHAGGAREGGAGWGGSMDFYLSWGLADDLPDASKRCAAELRAHTATHLPPRLLLTASPPPSPVALLPNLTLSSPSSSPPPRLLPRRRYSEELLLLARDHAWEYWEPRSTPDATSLVTGQSYAQFHDRASLDFLQTANGPPPLENHWYFCAQANFKLHHSFDRALAAILAADPRATLLLVRLGEVCAA